MTDPALRRHYFLELRRNGVTERDRKRWQRENGLPESTAEWTTADFGHAIQTLTSLRPTPEEEG